MKDIRVLMIAPSNNRAGDSKNKAGVWLQDIAAPYYIFKDNGLSITVASPGGGYIPVDIDTESPGPLNANARRFQQDEAAMRRFSNSLPLYQVNPANFDMVFITGSFGVMWDFADDKWINRVIRHCDEQQKPIGLVAHAVVALISSVTKQQEPLVKGRRLTAFSSNEAWAAGLHGQLPFSLETVLQSLGALYSKAEDFESYTVIDGNMVTGQNPASSARVAWQLLAMVWQLKTVPTLVPGYN